MKLFSISLFKLLVGIASLIAIQAVAQTTLKDAFKNDFLVGAALNEAQFCESNATEAAIVKAQFDCITPENALKWEKIHPEPGRYNFAMADCYVNFGTKYNMTVIGHNLIWHSQTPDWVFRDDKGNFVNRETLLARMREHIFAVVDRYKGKIFGWDVVNEALTDNGSLRNSPWLQIIGNDYIAKAFEFAHEADPNAKLYYNDYALEKAPKRAGALALIKKLQAQGIEIAGVGLQGHYDLTRPSCAQVESTISDFKEAGLNIMITELDINVLPSRKGGSLSADLAERQQMSKDFNPYIRGFPDSLEQQLAQRYADLFSVFLKHRDSITRVTFWGVTDGNSWLNDWPVQGRTNYPLLFDRQGRPKPAFYSLLKLTQGKPAAKLSVIETSSR